MTASTIIEIDKVSKTYQFGTTTVHALRDVSFSIEKGGMVALMGPSGSGKSTLLNLIGALDSASEGRVVVRGLRMEDLGSDERADFRNESVGFIFQNFNLIPVLTTLENVMLPSQLSSKRASTNLDDRAKALLDKVGLSEQAHQSVNSLSGGQMQRVAIARALMNKPLLILADEPTANLDGATAKKVLQVLKDLCANEDVTVVIATHDHSVLPYCRRVIQLRDGKLISDTDKI